MKNNSMMPFYGSDGSSLGFRELDTAKRLVAAGTVKPAYGRKGHLKAIFEQQEDSCGPQKFNPASGSLLLQAVFVVQATEHRLCGDAKSGG